LSGGVGERDTADTFCPVTGDPVNVTSTSFVEFYGGQKLYFCYSIYISKEGEVQ